MIFEQPTESAVTVETRLAGSEAEGTVDAVASEWSVESREPS